MSSLSPPSVYLSGASLILLLAAVSRAQYYDFTPAPDYEDYNATFEYSFYSNASSEDLDKFSERYIDQEEEEVEEGEEEDTGGQHQPEEKEEEVVTVTTATTRGTTERSRDARRNTASLPVSVEIWTLVWTLMILIGLNVQQLQHTL